MTEQQPAPRRSWLRQLFVFAALLTLLLVSLYFIATSAAFFEIILLPKFSQAIQAEVTVGDATIHHSRIVLRDLTVRVGRDSPWLTAKEVRLRYKLHRVISGRWHIEELVLDEPSFNLIRHADGTSNVGAENLGQAFSRWTAHAKEAPALDAVRLNKGQIRMTQQGVEGKERTVALQDVVWNLNNIHKARAGSFELAGRLLLHSQFTADEAPELETSLEGKFTFELTDAFKLILLQGRTELVVANAQGALARLEQAQSAFECQVTPTEIKQLLCSFSQHGTNLGVIQLTGPLDLSQAQGELQLLAHAIDPRLLKLFGLSTGLDFAWLQSTNRIQIRPSGAEISGRSTLTDLSLMLGTNKLSQAAAGLDLSASIQSQAQNFQGTLTLSNLIGSLGGWTLTNFMASVLFDLSNHQQRIDVRRIQVALPETPRAFNQLQLQGQLDRSHPDGWRGQFTLNCKSLDLTSFFVWIPQPPPLSSPDSAATEAPAPFIPAPPESARPPLKQLTSDVRIGQLYFHGLNLSNWSMRVDLDTKHVAIHAGTGWLNGGQLALEAGFDLGTNLVGTVKLVLTNANLTIPWLQSFLLPIADALQAPELAASPVNVLVLEATANEGRIELQNCRLQSAHFIAETHGALPIAEHLLDSTLDGWPMRLAIGRDLAEGMKLLPSEVPPNASYIFLPNFVRVNGTLGQPKPLLDVEALTPNSPKQAE